MHHANPGTPLPFEKAENFRELGGYVGFGGKHVRHGIFFRTPALCNVATPHDIALFESLGIKTVFDFRSSAERAHQPDPDFSAVTRFDISAITNPDGTEVNFDLKAVFQNAGGVQQMIDDVHQSYALLPFANKAYQTMFREICAGNTPVLFHCTAGKDRTGVAAALILLALGVPREDVIADYLLTNSCRGTDTAAIAKKIELLVPDSNAMEIAALVCGVRRESIELALDAITQKYPDFESYLAAECGVTDVMLAQMRADYLE